MVSAVSLSILIGIVLCQLSANAHCSFFLNYLKLTIDKFDILC